MGKFAENLNLGKRVLSPPPGNHYPSNSASEYSTLHVVSVLKTVTSENSSLQPKWGCLR